MFSTQSETTIRSGKKQLRFVNTNALVRNPKWQIGFPKPDILRKRAECLVMQTWMAERPCLWYC